MEIYSRAGAGIVSGDSLSVSSSEDMTVKLWDVENGDKRETLAGQPGDSSAVAFSAGWIASGGQEGVKLWAVENGTIKP